MSYCLALRHHVERSLERDLDVPTFGPDDDDDYGAVVADLMVWVRPLIHHDPPLVRVWTPAVHDVKKSARLLTELNDLNVGMSQTRCLLSGTSVMVVAEVEIESLTDGLLGRLVTQVGETAAHVGALIATVFGGECPRLSADSELFDEADLPPE